MNSEQTFNPYKLLPVTHAGSTLNQPLKNPEQYTEVEQGVNLHPKEILEIPPELDLETRKLHETLNAEIEFGADFLHPKKITEIPAELDRETQNYHSDLIDEVKQFANSGHLHPKQIVEIPVELNQEVKELQETLNKEVVQAGGRKHLHPKQIAEIPPEATETATKLHSRLIKEVKQVGGPEILQPKSIGEVPADLCQETINLQVFNMEVKLVGPRQLHPKMITEIPAELCQNVREAHKHLNEEINQGAYHLQRKNIVEIPVDLDQQIRDLHEDLNVEVEQFGGVAHLGADAGMDWSLEPPNEIFESVKQKLPSLTAEIKSFDRLNILRYAGQPNHQKHNGIKPKLLDTESFQTYVEKLLLLLADSGSDISLSKAASGDSLMNECVDRVVDTLIMAAKKLRESKDNKAILVQELNRRRGNIDVDDGGPAEGQREKLSNQERGAPIGVGGSFEGKAEEPVVVIPENKGFSTKNKFFRRLSDWKGSRATLIAEVGVTDPAYIHAKGAHETAETASATNGKDFNNEKRRTSLMRKIWRNPFRRHSHNQQADAANLAILVV